MPKIKGYRVPTAGAKSSDRKGKKKGFYYAKTKSHSIKKRKK